MATERWEEIRKEIVGPNVEINEGLYTSKALRDACKRIARLEDQVEACKMQARGWKLEARTQRATVLDCYRVVTKNRGVPGCWNGSEPVRQRIAELEAIIVDLLELAGGMLDESSGDHYLDRVMGEVDRKKIYECIEKARRR